MLVVAKDDGRKPANINVGEPVEKGRVARNKSTPRSWTERGQSEVSRSFSYRQNGCCDRTDGCQEGHTLAKLYEYHVLILVRFKIQQSQWNGVESRLLSLVVIVGLTVGRSKYVSEW